MKLKHVWIMVLVFVSALGFSAFAEVVPTAAPTPTPTVEAIAKEAEAKALAESIEQLEIKVAANQVLLEDMTLSEEQRSILVAENAVLIAEIGTKTEALALLISEPIPVILTAAEIDALKAEVATLKSKIAAAIAQLEDPNSTLDEAGKALLTASLEALKSELAAVQTALQSTMGSNPNGLRFQNAALLGITPGKMHLLEKLMAVYGDTELNLVEWASKSVKEINGEIKIYKKGFKVTEDLNVTEKVKADSEREKDDRKDNASKGKKDKK
jgi:hypothetical protein